MDSFDPYQQWLGIPSQLRPLNHYMLLGVRIYEADPNKIAAAYDTRMKLLKELQSGPRGELSQQLIAKVGKAKRDLLDPNRKAKYDSTLKKQLKVRQRQLDQAQEESLEAQPERAEQDLPAQTQTPAGETFPVSTAAGNLDSSVPKLRISETSPSPAPYQTEAATGDHTDQADEVLSPFWFLKDVRYLMGLLALSVVIMTATVKLLSPNRDQVSHALPASPKSAARQSDQAVSGIGVSGEMIAAQPKIQQAADGTFELPLERGLLDGAEVKFDEQVITNWGLGDQAAWMLNVTDSRKGYFNCKITYQAKSECRFEVRLGNRKPRPFTLYPHEADFEEEFIVRLAKAKKASNEQAFRLTAVDPASEVKIKRIVLVPNR